MSSHNDVIYIRLDVRGAKGQGKKKLYRRLGGVEVADQIAVVEWVDEASTTSMIYAHSDRISYCYGFDYVHWRANN